MIEKCTFECSAIYDENKNNRFVWRRVWDKSKPEICVITLNPGTDSLYELDLTSFLILNNTYRLENYGAVNVVNLFSVITDKLRKDNFENDDALTENIKYVKKVCKESEAIVAAWGKSGNSNTGIHEREELILGELAQFKDKLFIIVGDNGDEGVHPLTPSVRRKWNLLPYYNEA